MRFFVFLSLFCIFCFPVFASEKASMIHVYKEQRLMILNGQDGKPMRVYNIALGENPKGHKRREGDEKTPEGRYYIETRNPNSNYHLSLKISYPNAEDWENASRFGHSPGGLIMIHGLPNGKEWIAPTHTQKDWTDGCIAVTNEEIREIWELVGDGTPIQIWP